MNQHAFTLEDSGHRNVLWHRWVVERTFAWFRHFKRLTVRYERRADIHLAFLKLAACMICYSALG
jgi:transposase